MTIKTILDVPPQDYPGMVKSGNYNGTIIFECCSLDKNKPNNQNISEKVNFNKDFNRFHDTNLKINGAKPWINYIFETA